MSDCCDVKHSTTEQKPGLSPMQGPTPDIMQCPKPSMHDAGLEEAAAIPRAETDAVFGSNSDVSRRHVPIFIEACAGCAILSQTVKARGFRVLPIDCARNRHQPRCKVFELDLSRPHALDLLKRICDDTPVLCVHIALPCGTCSKARGIPLPSGAPGPPPLRDWGFLYGLPNVTPLDAKKLAAANQLYQTMCQLIEYLDARSIDWTIENPGNSWLWELPCMAFAVAHGCFYHLHACAYGGTRKKDTAFLASSDLFSVLTKFCDGGHDHEGWGYDHEQGVFNTSKEAEYPRLLCEAYADVLVRLAEQKGFLLDPFPDKDSAVQPQAQRTGRRMPQVVSEYEQVLTVVVTSIPRLNAKQCLVAQFGHVPAGAKLLRTEDARGKTLCVFGVYRSMQDFVAVARQLWHPFDELQNLPDELIKCLFRQLQSSMADLTKARIATLQRWTKIAKTQTSAEAALHSSLQPEIQKVLKGKRLLLLRTLAEEIGWPDTSLHDELKEGFCLTGYCGPTGVFKTEIRPAKMDKQQLMSDAKFLRPLIIGKLRSSGGSVEDEQTLYDITMEEALQKGWLHGPFSPEQISEQQPEGWLPVRRFGVWQKGKYRPIDDMKENHLNDCFSSCDKIDLHAMDNILWSLCVCIKFCLFNERMDFRLKDGSRLQAEVRSSWRSQRAAFSITAFDLASAYKQLPLNPKEYNCTIVTLRDPSCGAVRCFYMRTLPFGSVASVLHFNRISRLLWRLGLELGVVWGNYFDDFPTVSHSLQTASTMTCVQGLFKLLGFSFAEDKLAPFSERAEMLGVEVDVADATNGVIVVDNKQKRKEEMSAAIQEMLSEGGVIPSKLPSILGRIQFAELQLAGRMGKLAMADVRELGTESKSFVSFSATVSGALEMLGERMSTGKPRTLTVSESARPFVLFTDGAYEPVGEDAEVGQCGGATIGAVLFSPDGDVYTFGCRVDSQVLQHWLERYDHPIGLIELYAIITALKLFEKFLHKKRLLIFGDNWAANDVFVKGSSSIVSWRELLLVLERIDQRIEMLAWMARVPSASNIADPPSRGSLTELECYLPVLMDEVFCPVTQNKLENILKLK